MSGSSNETLKGKGAESGDGSDVSAKSLATQVMQLASLVKQNTRLLIQHGEDIMRIDAARMGISSTTGDPLPVPSSSSTQGLQGPQGGAQDGMGEEVIGELVQELQVKLDELEERSIRRVANSAARDPGDVIEWMPSPDPEVPELPPTMLSAFEAIDTKELLESMKFYGLAHYEEGMPLPTQAEFVALYNECARFLGIRSRKKQ